VATGARPAPATKGKTPAKVGKVSNRRMSGSSRRRFKAGEQVNPRSRYLLPTRHPMPFDKARQA
jgi:hypothetical protein